MGKRSRTEMEKTFTVSRTYTNTCKCTYLELLINSWELNQHRANLLATNDAYTCHAPIRTYMRGLILRINTLYRLFHFFKLFLMVSKGLRRPTG